MRELLLAPLSPSAPPPPRFPRRRTPQGERAGPGRLREPGRGLPRAAPAPPRFREPPLSLLLPFPPGAEETGCGQGGGGINWGEGLFLGAGRSFCAEPLPGWDESVRGACGEGKAAALPLCVPVAAGQLIFILGGL